MGIQTNGNLVFLDPDQAVLESFWELVVVFLATYRGLVWALSESFHEPDRAFSGPGRGLVGELSGSFMGTGMGYIYEYYTINLTNSN